MSLLSADLIDNCDSIGSLRSLNRDDAIRLTDYRTFLGANHRFDLIFRRAVMTDPNTGIEVLAPGRQD